MQPDDDHGDAGNGDILGRADALLKKHRRADASPADDADIPTLTETIDAQDERDDIPTLTSTVEDCDAPRRRALATVLRRNLPLRRHYRPLQRTTVLNVRFKRY